MQDTAHQEPLTGANTADGSSRMPPLRSLESFLVPLMLDLVKRAEKLLQDEFDDTQMKEYLEGEGFAPDMVGLAVAQRASKQAEEMSKVLEIQLLQQRIQNRQFITPSTIRPTYAISRNPHV